MEKESKYQSALIRKLKDRFPNCLVLKNDPNYIQGVPDLSIFWNERWGMLECKKNGKSNHQPNQDYYVDKLNQMSFASFIYPENEEEVLNALERSFKGYS